MTDIFGSINRGTGVRRKKGGTRNNLKTVRRGESNIYVKVKNKII